MVNTNTKIENVGIHHLALAASNYEKSCKFYETGLGFVKIAEWGEGKGRISLYDIGNGSCFEIFANGTAEPQTNARFIHFAFATTNPDLAYENAIKAGAESHIEPKNVTLQATPPIPARLAFVKGPDGELLEFFDQED